MDAGKVGTTHHLLCFGRRNTDTETRASLSLNLFVLFCFWRERERGGILLEQFHFNLIERAASYSVHSLKMHRIVKFFFTDALHSQFFKDSSYKSVFF